MRNTPLTDAAVAARKQDQEVNLVPASLAYQLEHRLAIAKELRAKAEELEQRCRCESNALLAELAKLLEFARKL